LLWGIVCLAAEWQIRDVAKQYVDYVRSHYGDNCILVFDGYVTGPSVKDQEHARRAKQSSPDIEVLESYPAYKNSALFFMNANNKQQFNNLLSVQLRKSQYTVHHAVMFMAVDL
jgi:hypothetical protein